MNPREADHIELIDVLRGLMALWVFTAHLSVACTGKVLSWGPPSSSVDIFMFISGLLMAYHWTNRQHKFPDTLSHSVDFYVRRFFRIAPLYYLLLTAALVGQEYFFEARSGIRDLVPPPWAAAAAGPNNPLDSTLTFANIISHFTFTFGFFPKYVANNILPDWSIGLEMQFYLIFPFLAVGMRRFGPVAMAAACIASCVLAHKLFGVYFNPGPLGNYPQPGFILLKINFFLSGMCVALACLCRDNPRRRILLSAIALLSLYNATTQVRIIVIGAMAVLFLGRDRVPLVSRVCSSAPARFAADISYSTYLLHNMLLYPILLALKGQPWFAALDPYAQLAIAFVAIGVPVLAISSLLFRFIERPGIRLGRRLSPDIVGYVRSRWLTVFGLALGRAAPKG